ncbi:MAG: fructose-1,6-bisphosphatase [Candidatus Cloacimonadales bacterium]
MSNTLSGNDLSKARLAYLNLLAEKFPNQNAVSTEIINLKAILNLPKGTEHFLSDLHGESEAFRHILKNASGVIKRKIERLFRQELTYQQRRKLAILIYYPKRVLEQKSGNLNEWYEVNLYRLIRLCQDTASKYTRSKVRKALPQEFAYIIDELLNEHGPDKMLYYEKIIQTIISLGRAQAFIIALCELIQRFVIDRLHVIGDIYDRGPGAVTIMDTLRRYHSVDIQWGNHDILWMGAASGSAACIANVLRISLRYNNLDTLEDGYGINLRPLATFAAEIYADDPCQLFYPRNAAAMEDEKELQLLAKMHKAITIIQFKLEGEIIQARPKFQMEERLLLDKIDSDYQVQIGAKKHQLLDKNFPTLDSNDPYKLSKGEHELINKLLTSFTKNYKLQKHIRFLYTHGGIYLSYNDNLLYHGCILLDKDGKLRELMIKGKKYRGKQLMDKFDQIARQAYFSSSQARQKYGQDIMWYLWCGAESPLFGKTKMASFERYFIADKATHKEEKNPYYKFRESAETCEMILEEFGLDPQKSHIINGHVPVKVRKGESPVKANNKLIVIDGGLAKAYQNVTGIAGYTLIYDSFGLQLISHEAFESAEKAIETDSEIVSSDVHRETTNSRLRVFDTDTGKELNRQILALKELLEAYRMGLIKQDLS